MGLHSHSDKDINDMEANYMGLTFNSSDLLSFHNTSIFVSSLHQDIPDSMDWRSKGAVTPVKNQGSCGSCWAFSAIGALESRNFLLTNKLIPLSEQNLVDCDEKNLGCSGGWMATAYDYIRDNAGIDTETSYPYKGTRENCKFSQANVGATCSGYTAIEQGNENDLKDAVATLGPFAVGIGVTDNFMNYKSGILDDNSCEGILNHGVLVVGYGSDDGKDYWLVKNSWGPNWGDGGYIKMSRNKNNQCSIASYALIPNV